MNTNPKLCTAGHSAVQHWCVRCPVCWEIERLDTQLLKADIRIELLEAQLSEAQIRIDKLTNEKVSNLKENWNGGAT